MGGQCRQCKKDIPEGRETYCSEKCRKDDLIKDLECYKDDNGNITESGKKFLKFGKSYPHKAIS